MRRTWSVLSGKCEGKISVRNLSRNLTIILKCKALGLDVSDWLYLAEDRDKWQAIVNTLMGLRVHNKRGIGVPAVKIFGP